MKRLVSSLALGAVFSWCGVAVFAEESTAISKEAAATVVVYNESDPDSRDLARYYMAKRDIPKENVVALKCSQAEEISRLEFDTEIAEPLRAAFEKNGWWRLRPQTDPPRGEDRLVSNRIRFLALMRGIPLKVRAQAEPYEGDRPDGPAPISADNKSAVDSELAVLGLFSRQISGALKNPYFRGTERAVAIRENPMLLVCRLDAPTPRIVRQMIDDASAAERRGLRGMVYIDARGTKEPGLVDGDKWLFNAAHMARRQGLVTLLDSGEGLFPTGYPMSRAAFYFGWYSENVAGPFTRPDFRFVPGAVAVHIHSFSAATLREPPGNWCGPLLAAGAAATLGNVYEPYLGLTPNLDVFFDRLRAGFTFAESAYMAQPALSWMTTFVGDPLYRPLRAFDGPSSREPRDEWDAYAAGAKIWFEKGPDAGAKSLKAAAQKYRSGLILEGLGMLQLAAKQGEEATNTFETAATVYREPDDVLRATIHEFFQLKAMNRSADAVKLARKRIAQFPKSPGAEVLRLIEADLSAALAPPPATARAR